MYPILFKYCRNHIQNEYVIDIFKNNRLHLTPHSKLNDIFDCRINLDTDSLLNHLTEKTDQFIEYKKVNPKISLEEFRKIRESDLQDRNAMNWVLKSMYDEIFFGVTCFSKTNKNDILWAYYTDSFKGICLEFDFNNLTNGLLSEGLLKEVEYSNDFLSVKSIVDLKQLLFRKKTCYSEEQEWRIAVPLKKQDESEYFVFNKPNLKAIYFGSKIDQMVKFEMILQTKLLDYKLKYYEMYSEFDSMDIHFKEMDIKDIEYYLDLTKKERRKRS